MIRLSPDLLAVMYEEWNAEIQAARDEYELSRAAADEPVMCARNLHEMTPENIRFDGNNKRHCVACERVAWARRKRRKREHQATD